MLNRMWFAHGTAVLPDRLLPDCIVGVEAGRIAFVGQGGAPPDAVDLGGGYLLPGFVDLHVHGGDGADFMDATPEAFRAVCRAHARHGTTTLLPTTTVARTDQLTAVLALCRRFLTEETGGARAVGAHLYGPFFAPAARGCHPDAARPPSTDEVAPLFAFADAIRIATVAPELPGADDFIRDCRARGIRCNAGHSHATFERMEAAVALGVRHVDHLFCAMSDRARLRQTQTYPMRGGVLEATLLLDELTTEVIADGKHLADELLRLALKAKGPDRLALVTDANRALGMPDGEYIFGPLDGGERILKYDGVGLMPDGQALASGVSGLDHCVRTMLRATGVSLPECVRMASLTPARIAGLDAETGSIEPGKRADLIVADADLCVRRVVVGGREVYAG